MARKKGKRWRQPMLWDGPWGSWRPPVREGMPCGHDRHDWSWVESSLATGGMPASVADVDALVAAGITHVVNTATEDAAIAESVLGHDPRIRYLWNPTPDDGRWKPRSWFDATIDFALPAIENGDRVLVHCHCGSNRGPSSAYAVLLAMGFTPAVAETMVRAARPKARLMYLEDARKALA